MGWGGIISLNFSTDSCFATSGRDGSSCEKLVAQNFKKILKAEAMARVLGTGLAQGAGWRLAVLKYTSQAF